MTKYYKSKYYKSKYYSKDIEVERIDWELLVNIITEWWKKIIYSWYDLEDKTSYSPYIKNAVLASLIWEIPKNILVLGFWWWSYAKYFKDYMWEKINITWVEIDEAMIEVAKNEFQLNNINYFNMWAIEAIDILKNKKKNKFDTIFIDIYDKNSKIPDFINTLDFWKNLKLLSLEDSKIIINYANNIDNEKYYEEIHNNIINIFPNNHIKILNNKDDNWNIIWVYNLKKKLNSEELVLEYLSKVQNWEINYDSNIISNIYLK